MIFLWIFVCILCADLITGVMHWIEDAYAVPGISTVLDRFIVFDNIEHHRNAGKITRGSWFDCNRVCIALSAIVALCLIAFRVHSWQPYLVIILSSHSNQIHAWAHAKQVPTLVRWLQNIGIFQSRSHHAEHHRKPYAIRFCTSTNYLNPVLDGIRFWSALEFCIKMLLGVPVKRLSEARGGF